MNEKKDVVIKSANKSKNHEVLSKSRIGRFFKFNDFNATIKKEIIGGISTFLAMVYILSVAPNILGDANSLEHYTNGISKTMNKNGIFLATVIITFASTLIMGLSANIPSALSVGMGSNAMFTYTVANQAKLGYEGALIATMISGILFCVVSVSKIRQLVIMSLPKSIHTVIGIGIGFFVAYVGIADIGIVAKNDAGIPIAQLNTIKKYFPEMIIGLIVAFSAIFLHYRKFMAPIAVTILVAFVLVVILANSLPDNKLIQDSFGSAKWVTGQWDYKKMFTGFGSNISDLFKEFGNKTLWTNPSMYISIFIFTILGFFDATGALTALNVDLNKSSLIERKISSSALVIDGASSVVGSFVGVSHINCFVESSVGVSQGAKTGFASIVTALIFLLSIVLFPFFLMIPPCITGAATLFVGVLMISNITDIEWKKPEIAFAGFMVILTIIITYNITNGIAIGLIAYTVGACANKKTKELTPMIWIVDIIFIVYFVLYAFIQ